MGLLSTIGKILTLIGGILVLVNIILNLLNVNLGIPADPVAGFTGGIGGDIIGLIITIVAAVGLIAMSSNKWGINEEWLEGVLIIVLAFFAGSGLALVGGILVLISGLL